jgi:hypothetical protein
MDDTRKVYKGYGSAAAKIRPLDRFHGTNQFYPIPEPHML